MFGIAAGAGGQLMCDAAIDAAYELGVFDTLARPRSLAELAAACHVPAGHRLRALVDVLAAIGAVARDGDRFATGSPPPRATVIRAGWGLLADVIRSDRPLADPGDPELVRRMHRHLVDAGAPAARELVELLVGARSLADLGGGAGAYTAAFLDADPRAHATLVDEPPVLALARDELARFGARVSFVASDARTASLGGDHACALLANVLHLHAPAACAELCAAAARAVAPGGIVAIHDLRVDPDRRGPLEGLLFALGMAIYTDGGDVYDVSQIRAWLRDAGLAAIEARRLAAAPNSVVVLGRKPLAADRELDAALARTGRAAWQELAGDGALRADAQPATLELPASLRRSLATAIADARGEPCADQLLRHYTEVMPRMRVVQLAGTAEPAATLFHIRLDWARLPRLRAAIDRLFAILAAADVDATTALGAASPPGFRDRTPTLATLYARTHYGGAMPLLYGYPADLAYFASHGLDVLATIDRYLTAPIVHELCHFARDREALAPPHLDECIAGWLGVYVHPELAYPARDCDDALYAAPWLAQVGQAIARAFGVTAVVRAQAGAVGWTDALSPGFVDTAARLGREDWLARRTLHLLADTFDPAPWIALAFASRAGCALDRETLPSLASIRLVEVAPPEDPDFDRAIVADALRAMCLDNVQIDGSFRARSRLPGVAIDIDALACRVTRPLAGPRSPESGPTFVDRVVPAYWLPPAVAARILARGLSGYTLALHDIDAIDDAAAAICEAAPEREAAGFALVGQR